ncbi:FHA domain-containing protein [Agromyces mariniharenae]|uniref:FHA domain-containing protein n=1 Tax=Agromyces mariniharenae TaxID=2604423 RepID=A0A5S4UUH5_9MICO|nr:FHA domain-containing protein [Agromyces mariniharenae]TYL50587.1 FHA domain-containing protein [Agromyces mariniharenae]
MATYRPDPAHEWIAAVRGGVVLLAPTAAATEVTALWPRLADADPTPAVLDVLTSRGLAATPPFALVVRDANDGSARVVARGPVVVHVGAEVVPGSGVSTWAERVVEAGDAEVRVEAVSDGIAADAAAALPVVEAIVLAVSVRSGGVERVAPEAPASGDAVDAVDEQTRVVARDAAVPVAASVSAPVEAPAQAPPPVAAPAPSITVPPEVVAAVTSAEQTIVPAEDTIAAPVTPPSPDALHELDGDHDGLTVASVDIRRLRAERAARQGSATPGRVVPAAEAAPSSSLRMPDGSIESIGAEVLLGRSPSVSQVSGGRLPRLVTIGAGDPDISRNHLRVAVEGDTVVVTDLHSRNGTHVVAPGKSPVKLRAGEPTPVLAGTVVDLGGGWTIQVVGA